MGLKQWRRTCPVGRIPRSEGTVDQPPRSVTALLVSLAALGGEIGPPGARPLTVHLQRCARCQFISVSLAERDCGWFASCSKLHDSPRISARAPLRRPPWPPRAAPHSGQRRARASQRHVISHICLTSCHKCQHIIQLCHAVAGHLHHDTPHRRTIMTKRNFQHDESQHPAWLTNSRAGGHVTACIYEATHSTAQKCSAPWSPRAA